MPNIPNECRSANIVRDHAMILPNDATLKQDGIFGKDTERLGGLEVDHQLAPIRLIIVAQMVRSILVEL